MTRLPRPSVRNQRRLTRGMQLRPRRPRRLRPGRGAAESHRQQERRAGSHVPAGAPGAKLRAPARPWLGLWITTAVFLHTLGSAGLYGQIGWWDHLTHALSATLVAGVGYTTARAIDLHSDEISIPHRFAFVYIVVVVLSFGVVWELFEFGLDIVADETGLTMPLAQHGLDDTVMDLTYNSLGALLVAAFGQVHLTGVAETVRTSLWTAE